MLKAQTLTEVSCDKVVPWRPWRHKMTHDMVLCFSLTNDIVCYNMVLKTRHGTCYHETKSMCTCIISHVQSWVSLKPLLCEQVLVWTLVFLVCPCGWRQPDLQLTQAQIWSLNHQFDMCIWTWKGIPEYQIWRNISHLFIYNAFLLTHTIQWILRRQYSFSLDCLPSFFTFQPSWQDRDLFWEGIESLKGARGCSPVKNGYWNIIGSPATKICTDW